ELYAFEAGESSLLPGTSSPFPHSKHRLLRNRMPHLSGKYAYLATMVLAVVKTGLVAAFVVNTPQNPIKISRGAFNCDFPGFWLCYCSIQSALVARAFSLRNLLQVSGGSPMTSRISFVLVVALSLTAVAQDHAAHQAQTKPVTLVTGLGNLHHPVSTKNPEAQKFFDQGLRFIYAFNHDEAARSFQHAGELDPKLAVAWWGVAEAVGPNYNDPADDPRFAKAHEAIQTAVDLSGNASASEKAYIDAMAKRFPADSKADRRKAAEEYNEAMREVVKNF